MPNAFFLCSFRPCLVPALMSASTSPAAEKEHTRRLVWMKPRGKSGHLRKGSWNLDTNYGGNWNLFSNYGGSWNLVTYAIVVSGCHVWGTHVRTLTSAAWLEIQHLLLSNYVISSSFCVIRSKEQSARH